MVEEYRERREIVVEALNDIAGFDCIKPKGTFYVFPSIRGLGVPSAEFAERMLKEAKVATIPDSAFGESGENHLRMAIAVSKSDLLRAMKRIENFVKLLLR